MKKRLFALLLVVALVVCGLALSANAAGTLSYQCQRCNATVQWEPVVFGTHYATSGTTTATNKYHGSAKHLHYYLDKDYTVSEVKQMNINEGITLCLDLRGHKITSNNRVLYPNKNATVSVMDSVGTGEIIVNTKSDGNNIAGGLAYLDTGSTLNIYGGTYTLGDNTSQRTKTGGVIAIQNNAVCNLYGGTINGGVVNPTGGTGGAVHVYAGGHLKVYNDTVINAGTAPVGNCVYTVSASSQVTLSGTAQIDEVYFSYNDSKLFVENGFTGSANITYNTANVAVGEGLKIGTGTGSIGPNLRCTNGEGYFINAVNGDLVLSAYQAGATAGVSSASGIQGYESLQEAIDACQDGYVALLKDTTENVTVNKDLVLALNGNSVTGTITVAEGCTLYGMDNKTDDYTVADGDYGKLTNVVGAVTGLCAESEYAEDGYLAVNENGAWSFHRVNLQIYAMTLRAENAGVYYKSNFAGDELVAKNVAKFGIALNVVEAPDADNMETTSEYSWFTQFQSGALANRGNATSTLLTEIMTPENSEMVNNRNANVNVHGRAYIRTKDGAYVFGENVTRNLVEQMEGVDSAWDQLSQVQAGKVLDMYKNYSSVMKTWTLPNIQKENQKAEDAMLKVLVLGNSHGLDATNMLYEVFQDQNPQQKVLVGALYYSGCNMTQHKTFITNNDPVYSYHKNYGQNQDRSWDIYYNSTVLTALEDEQWDIIVMQQMNHRAGMDNAEWGNYRADDWQFVIDYLKEHQDYEPRLAFHMVWANPDQEEYRDPNSPLSHPTKTNNDWVNTHDQKFPGADGKYDIDVLYNSIVSCTQKYLVDTTAFLGENYYEFIIPSGTAVQYALRELNRTQAEIYRDYTHMNDYGRLLVAYLWYAKIMGVDKIDSVGINAIPAVLHHSNSSFPTTASGYAVTADMKADIIASVNWALENPFNLPE